MTVGSELRLRRTATAQAARPLRHALGAFLTGLEIGPDRRDDILTAVGEVLANAVEHAYRGAPGEVELYARIEDDDATLAVEVSDGGGFIERERLPGRGLGLRIVRAIARTVSIDTTSGTRVRMVFDAR